MESSKCDTQRKSANARDIPLYISVTFFALNYYFGEIDAVHLIISLYIQINGLSQAFVQKFISKHFTFVIDTFSFAFACVNQSMNIYRNSQHSCDAIDQNLMSIKTLNA